MSRLIELKNNPIFIGSLVDSIEHPSQILRLGEVNKEFNDLTMKNNLFWYLAIKKWFPNSASARQEFNLRKDYRRNFAFQLGSIIQ